MLGDEGAHHFHAFGKIDIDYFDAMAAHEIGSAGKVPTFAHDHFFDAELHDCAGAEVAGHERGIQNGIVKMAESSGVPQTIYFRVRDRIVVLDPLVVTDSDQFV